MDGRSGLGGQNAVDTVAASGKTIADRNKRAPGGKPREWGMFFTVTSDPDPSNNTHWILRYGLSDNDKYNNANWQRVDDYLSSAIFTLHESFQTDGVASIFALSLSPKSVRMVEINGSLQRPDIDYSVVDNNIVFRTPPTASPDGTRNLFVYFQVDAMSFSLAAKRENLLALGCGQSNFGGTSKPTGRIPFADMPDYLRTMDVSNIWFVDVVSSNYVVSPWTIDPSLEWGWFIQYLFVMKPHFKKILFAKETLGGTDILPGGGGLYPTANFYSRCVYAVQQANAMFGAGNYTTVLHIDIGETNAVNQVGADAYKSALTERINYVRTNIIDCVAIIRKQSRRQDVDFPYLDTVRAAIDQLAGESYKNQAVDGLKLSFELQDQNDDFSHLNKQGAVVQGIATANKHLSFLKLQKVDAVKPIIVSLIVSNASPDEILMTLSKPVNPCSLPFYKDFTLSSGRKVLYCTPDGNVLRIKVSEPYYINQVETVSYQKRGFFEAVICDYFGNELDSFPAKNVTNQVTAAVPVYTLIYQSAFVTPAGVDGWVVAAGATHAVVDGIDGENNVLEITMTGTTLTIYKPSVAHVAGSKYRARIRLKIPKTFGDVSKDYNVFVKQGTTNNIFSNLYQFTRCDVVDGFVDYEFTYVADGSSQIRIEAQNTAAGRKLYLKSWREEKIN